MTAYCHSVDTLGAYTAGNDFRLRRIEVAPRTRHHTDTATIFQWMYKPHFCLLRKCIAVHRAVFESIGWRRTHLRLDIHLEGALEYRMVFIPVVGVIFETETEPVIFRTKRATKILARLGNAYGGTVEIVWQIFWTFKSNYPSLIISFYYFSTQCLGFSVENCDVIVFGHLCCVVFALYRLHFIETLAQELLEIGSTHFCRLSHNSGVLLHGDIVEIGRTADIQHTHTLLGHHGEGYDDSRKCDKQSFHVMFLELVY